MNYIVAALFYIALMFTVVYGYISNIISIFSSFDAMATGEAVVRIAGIFIPVVGVVAGYF